MKKAFFVALFALLASCGNTVVGGGTTTGTTTGTGGNTTGTGGVATGGTATGGVATGGATTGTGIPFTCSDPACEAWGGTWNVSPVSGSINLAYVQNGTKIQGAIDIGDSSCWLNAQIDGTIQADNMTFGAVLADGKKITFTGTITGSDASGSFIDESNCSPPGSWTVSHK